MKRFLCLTLVLLLTAPMAMADGPIRIFEARDSSKTVVVLKNVLDFATGERYFNGANHHEILINQLGSTPQRRLFLALEYKSSKARDADFTRMINAFH